MRLYLYNMSLVSSKLNVLCITNYVKINVWLRVRSLINLIARDYLSVACDLTRDECRQMKFMSLLFIRYQSTNLN